MRKYGILIILAAVVGMFFISSSAYAGKPSPGSIVKFKTLKASAVDMSKGVKKCVARASKWEAPAPPADPQSKCRGVVRVHMNVVAEAKCKRGWWGGRARAATQVWVVVRVFAFAKSVASISRTRARTMISKRFKVKMKARVTCVKSKKPKPTPPKEKCPEGMLGVPPNCYWPKPPPEACPPGWMGTPPNCYQPPNPDRAPQVSQVLPAHLYTGGNGMVWVEAYDPDGDPVSINVVGSGAGWISGIIPVSIRWDGSPCPSGKQCFRATAWAGSSPGMFYVNTTATAGGKSSSVTGNFEVKEDDFGDW